MTESNLQPEELPSDLILTEPSSATPSEEPGEEIEEATLIPATLTPEETAVLVQSTSEGQSSIPQALLDAILQDLASRLGMEVDQIQILSIQSVLWNDSSLGCPEKGMMYLQVLTPGYQVLLQAQGRQYDYRTDEAGTFKLCP